MKISQKLLHHKLFIRALLPAFFLGIMLSACGGKKAAKSDIYIPKNASVAAVIDLKKISSKASDWRDIFKTEFLDQFDINIDDQEVERLVLLTEKIIPTISQDSKISIFNGQVSKDRSKNYFALIFSIEDVNAFEKALSADKGIKIMTEEDSKHVFLDEKTILSWKGASGLFAGFEFKIDNAQQVLKSKVAEIRKTTASDALETNNKEFKALLAEDHDVAIWANQQETSNFTPAVEMYSKISPTIANLAKANQYGTSYIDFMDGKIVMNGKAFLDKKLSGKYQPILNVNNEKVMKSLPIKDPLLLLSLSLNMEDIRKIMEEEQAYDKFDGEALVGLALIGLNVKDIAEMLSGDIVVAIEDLQLRDLQKPDVQLVLGIGLNRKEVLIKILSKYVESGLLVQKDNVYELKTSIFGVSPQLILTDDAVFLTATKSFMEAIVSSKSTILNKEMKEKAQSSNFLVFLRPDQIINKVPKENFSDELFEALFPKIESVIINTLPAKKDLLEGNVTINFKDKSKNALEQLMSVSQKKNVE